MLKIDKIFSNRQHFLSIAYWSFDNLTYGKIFMSAPSKACDFLSVQVRYGQSLADSPSPMIHQKYSKVLLPYKTISV